MNNAEKIASLESEIVKLVRGSNPKSSTKSQIDRANKRIAQIRDEIEQLESANVVVDGVDVGTKVIVPTGETGTIKSIKNGVATIKYRYTIPGRELFAYGKYEYITIEIPVADVVVKTNPKAPKSTLTKRELMFAAYMHCYWEFAVNTREIAKHLNVSIGVAYRTMIKLGDLVCGEIQLHDDGGFTTGEMINAKTNPGTPMVWQCVQTYDHVNKDEAIALFNAAFPE